jgi:hypothetical protein
MANETPVERVQIQAMGMATTTVIATASTMAKGSGSFQWIRISPAE